MTESQQRLAFIINTAGYERVAFALATASAASALGKDVRILFGHGGVARLRENATDRVDKATDHWLAKRISLGIEQGSITPISELLEAVKKLGGKIYACPEAMELHGLVIGDLIAEVDEVRSLVRFVTEDMADAQLIYV